MDENYRFASFGQLQQYQGRYAECVTTRADVSRGINLPEGYAPATTFFALRKSDNKVVGIVDVRHKLTEYLFNYGGHIGYTVLPSERRQGYGVQILTLALDYCKSIDINKVLVTCVDYNKPSCRTIEKCGGVLENKIVDFNGRSNADIG